MAGGYYNRATGHSAAIGGGFENEAAGDRATVPGGTLNSAAGYLSFAAGYRAKANHYGSFVWADSTDADFTSTATNRFHIRVRNGLELSANNIAWGARFTNDGSGDGLRTYANVSKGNAWAALYAVNAGTSPAIYGWSSGGYAAYLQGNVQVTGILTKGGGAFKIDHPLDPENKYLVHSFVESPDMMNVYNGNVVLDANGEAVVRMADYFEALNRDFRYQLTCIGGFAPVYISQKMQSNEFVIAGGEPGMEVSWQITGIRQDAFAEAHRIQVEVNKTTADQGKYLHPVEFGKPLSMGIGSEARREKAQQEEAR